MKIGIITWFDGPNYGTNLQAIALQRYLRNYGHCVEIVNFSPPDVVQVKKTTFWQKLKYLPQRFADIYSKRKNKNNIALKLRKLENEVKNQVIFTDKVTNEKDFIRTCNSFDVLIFGSDQIWNPNWYHKYYFADYPEIKAKKVSYAPSLGVLCVNEKQIENIKNSLEGFSMVSVREEQGADIIEHITGTRPQVVVDPTFLLNASQWESILDIPELKEEDYVLSMFLTDNLHHWLAASKFARSHKLKHTILPYCGFSYMQKGEVKPDVGLRELLSLIKGAKFILTDSFHIAVFSIIFKKEFYIFMRFKDDGFASQNTRIINLLHMLKLQDREVPYSACTINEKSNIDYTTAFYELNKKIYESKQYINKALGGGSE